MADTWQPDWINVSESAVNGNIWNDLSRQKQSLFYRLDPEYLKRSIGQTIQVATTSPSHGYHPQINRAHREGFLLEKASMPFSYLYFTNPGSLLIVRDWDSTWEAESFDTQNLPFISLCENINEPVYLNSLYHYCRPIGLLRNLQVAGLLEFMTDFNRREISYDPYANENARELRWLGTLILGNNSRVFRIPLTSFQSFCNQNATIVPLINRAIFRRFFEGHEMKLLKDQGRHDVVLAKHILEYCRSTGKKRFGANQFRVAFYAGLQEANVKLCVDRLRDANVLSGQKGKYRVDLDSIEEFVGQNSPFSTSLPD